MTGEPGNIVGRSYGNPEGKSPLLIIVYTVLVNACSGDTRRPLDREGYSASHPWLLPIWPTRLFSPWTSTLYQRSTFVLLDNCTPILEHIENLDVTKQITASMASTQCSNIRLLDLVLGCLECTNMSDGVLCEPESKKAIRGLPIRNTTTQERPLLDC
ncbi:hypothetical protein BDV26DRAFT_24083 [Aspergillus bertholletiae]|uniref:Uncharacterized protein n=1 Tax=Aspergillus bertholletiae TaxID=1226010 RepID=A0A5N7AYU1_9EURO|nr:hypothetical protein BDV26DRAFT_24083 [Aspergillus bertholletiae]